MKGSSEMGRIADTQKFMREVQVEAKKVTWPERKETIQATLMVFVMVILISLFLYLVDWGLESLIGLVI
ncbi:MAG: preprotein translocase subunit SecE [Mariprofundaceae bacterium]|nr:preprotein translocase subunit SecE [Mariprofundaceae bacterium]